MKLLHITHQYRPAIGGSEEYIAGISETLAARGHEVEVFTTNSVDYLSWTGALPATEIIAGVSVRRFRCIPRRSRTWWILAHSLYPYLTKPRRWQEPLIIVGNGPLCPSMPPAIVAEGRRCDVVHLNQLHYAHAAYGYAAARLAGRPVAITPHIHVEQRETWDVGYMRRILEGADLIFAQTEYERQFHIRRGKNPAQVVTGGVGLRLEDYCFEDRLESRRLLGLPETGTVVLCLGRQIEYKGMEKVLAAAAELVPSHPELLVLLVGPETAWSRGILQGYSGMSWLHNLGEVSSAEKLAALSASDLMVMPSHGEALGITYLESWLASRPVVGLAKGAVQWLIDDGIDGLLVPPDDPEALLNAMRRLIENRDQASEMGRRGQQKVLQRYTIDKITDIIEDACLRLATERDPKSARKHNQP